MGELGLLVYDILFGLSFFFFFGHERYCWTEQQDDQEVNKEDSFNFDFPLLIMEE